MQTDPNAITTYWDMTEDEATAARSFSLQQRAYLQNTRADAIMELVTMAPQIDETAESFIRRQAYQRGIIAAIEAILNDTVLQI